MFFDDHDYIVAVAGLLPYLYILSVLILLYLLLVLFTHCLLIVFQQLVRFVLLLLLRAPKEKRETFIGVCSLSLGSVCKWPVA